VLSSNFSFLKIVDCDWLIDWLIDRLIDRLIYWLILLRQIIACGLTSNFNFYWRSILLDKVLQESNCNFCQWSIDSLETNYFLCVCTNVLTPEFSESDDRSISIDRSFLWTFNFGWWLILLDKLFLLSPNFSFWWWSIVSLGTNYFLWPNSQTLISTDDRFSWDKQISISCFLWPNCKIRPIKNYVAYRMQL